MKKILVPVGLLLLLALVVMTATGCSVTTNVVNATVYSPESGKATDAAEQADAAVAGLSRSPNIQVPLPVVAGKLTIGYDEAYPPLGFSARVITKLNEKGEPEVPGETLPVGVEVDLMTAVAKKLGLEPVFVKIDWRKMQSQLAEGKVDVVASGVITSAELSNALSASDTYLSADLAICTKMDSELQDQAALAGKVVGVQQGSAAEARLAADSSVAETRVYPHVLGAFAELSAGKVDAVVIERPVATWILANHADYSSAFKITGNIESEEGYAAWCRKDAEALVAAINAAVTELREAPASATTSVTVAATGTSVAPATTTTALVTDTAAGVTTTTVPIAPPAKSIYQLILEKWGLTEAADQAG